MCTGRSTVVFIILFSLMGAAQAAKLKGISYTAWWPGAYSTADADRSLAALAETGAEWISLIVTGHQDTISSATIERVSPPTPTDDDLIHVIVKAHELGLKVMLKPHVDLSKDSGHWRGQIGTSFSMEKEWEDWFASYREFIYHYADLAKANRADQFCVGTELDGTDRRESDWRAVISGVRERFNGPIVYASNHGREAEIAWWDALDFIGVDAYYALTDKDDPTALELKASWSPHVSALADLSSRWGKRVLLTEIGYRSLDGACRHPWDWQISGAVDLKEQADAYQAAFESVFNASWFGGMFWWDWGTNPSQGGVNDTGYTVHGKPAEEVVRSWYAGEVESATAGWKLY